MTFLRGGDEVTGATLSRFFGFHVAVLPGIFTVLLGMHLLMVQRRKYPPDDFMAHVLGYVGDVSPEDIARSHGRYRPGDVAGKSGIEREYNSILMGVDGSRRVIVDSRGRVRGTLSETPAIPGKTIRLTIDEDLERVAELVADGVMVAVVDMVWQRAFVVEEFAVHGPTAVRPPQIVAQELSAEIGFTAIPGMVVTGYAGLQHSDPGAESVTPRPELAFAPNPAMGRYVTVRCAIPAGKTGGLNRAGSPVCLGGKGRYGCPGRCRCPGGRSARR